VVKTQKKGKGGGGTKQSQGIVGGDVGSQQVQKLKRVPVAKKRGEKTNQSEGGSHRQKESHRDINSHLVKDKGTFRSHLYRGGAVGLRGGKGQRIVTLLRGAKLSGKRKKNQGFMQSNRWKTTLIDLKKKPQSRVKTRKRNWVANKTKSHRESSKGGKTLTGKKKIPKKTKKSVRIKNDLKGGNGEDKDRHSKNRRLR